MFRFLTICVFVFLLAQIGLYSSVNVPKFGKNSVSEFAVNSKNKNLILEILIDEKTLEGNYKIVNSEKSTAKEVLHFTFGNSSIKQFDFTVTKDSKSFIMYLIINDSIPKSKIILEILDSIGRKSDDLEINITRNSDETPYLKHNLFFSLGAAYTPEIKLISPDLLYSDFIGNLDISESYYLDFGFRNTVYKKLVPNSNFSDGYVKQYNLQGYDPITETLRGNVEKEFKSVSYNGWLSFYHKHSWNFEKSKFKFLIGPEIEFRHRSLALYNTVLLSDSVKSIFFKQKSISINGKDTIINTDSISKSFSNQFIDTLTRNVNEVNYGLSFITQYDCELFFASVKYGISLRRANDIDSKTAFNDDETIKASNFTNEYIADSKFSIYQRLNFELLSKIGGYKFGLEIRSYHGHPNESAIIDNEFNIYVAKEYSIQQVGKLIGDLFGI